MLSLVLVRRRGVHQFLCWGAAKSRQVTFQATGSNRVGDVIVVEKRGVDLLHDPLYNKGTAFSLSERERLRLRGLVPPRILPHDGAEAIQLSRVSQRYSEIKEPLVKYMWLNSLQDRNEVLFYQFLVSRIEELAPIIYTPTVGLACQRFGHIFRRARGMYFSSYDWNNMNSMVYNWPIDDVQIAVVTDGSRVLGLGDLGMNGMGIPIGKLSLYSAAAGIHPSRTLPCLLDVGTNNETLLKEPMYLGVQHRRLTGEDYMVVVDEFITALRQRWPNILIQFEDFSNDNALRLLEKYRHSELCFNDDIQGTGAVCLAGVLGALRVLNRAGPRSILNERIVVCGAGSAGIGVANTLKFALRAAGASSMQARKQFWMFDVRGSLGRGRTGITLDQEEFVRHDVQDKLSLLELVRVARPTILIGVTGVGGLFTEEVIREMAYRTPTPIIFPLSNPTASAECTLEQACEWTDGACVFASGSPFEPVQFKGKTIQANQANNMYTFPGIGLGAIACLPRSITDPMLHAAGVKLALALTEDDLRVGRIFPSLSRIREVSCQVACAVCETARDQKINTLDVPPTTAGVRALVKQHMWHPKYGQLVQKA